MAELVVVWSSGEINRYTYSYEAEAEEAGRNLKTVFGNQVEWYGVNALKW